MKNLYLLRSAVALLLALPLAGQAQNVGIGTTSPTQALDVNGSLRVRGLSGGGGLPVVQPDGTLGLSAPVYQAGPAASGTPTSAFGTVATGSSPQSVAVSGTTAYVVNEGSNSLQVFDVAVPSAPRLLSTVATGSSPRSVAVSGTAAYVVNTIGGSLQVFDLAVPSAPRLLGTVRTSNGPQSVTVSGTTAYVVSFYGSSTNNRSSLQVFDVAVPNAPSLLGTVDTDVSPRSVAVSGTTAYVVSYYGNSLQVFDVAVPSAPRLLGFATTDKHPQSVAVSGTTAYVVNEATNSLQVFDVAVPSAPRLLGTVATDISPQSVAVSGTTAYVVSIYNNSLQVFDVAVPSAPRLLGTVATGSSPRSVAVSGTTAYVVNEATNSLQVFVSPSASRVVVAGPDGSLASVAAPTLSVSGQSLSISGGNTVTLPTPAGDNLGNHTATQQLALASQGLRFSNGTNQTTAPQLTLSGQTLGLAGGNTVTLPTPAGDNLGNHTATQNLNLAGYQLVGQGGSQGMSVTSSGNVGIGTGAPTQKLDVNGNQNLTGTLQLNTGDQDKIFLTSQGAAGSKLGHAPGWGLLSYAGPGSGNQSYHAWLLSYSKDYVEGMRLTLTGLGIGTSTPAAKLDVNGDANISGTLSLGVTNVSQAYSLLANSNAEYSIKCPSGTYLLTGGGGHRQANSAQQSVIVNYNGPSEASPTTTWTLRVTNTASTARDIYLNCNCARLR